MRQVSRVKRWVSLSLRLRLSAGSSDPIIHFQALNNLQCTSAGYGTVTKEAVYKICDEPHPEKMREMFELCVQGESQRAFEILDALYHLGYSVDDLLIHHVQDHQDPRLAGGAATRVHRGKFLG